MITETDLFVKNFFCMNSRLEFEQKINLKVHKHEIILIFFETKSNPYMPLVNFRKNFASFPSIFARISMFAISAVTEHRRNQIFLMSYPKFFFFKIFTLVLLDEFLDGF